MKVSDLKKIDHQYGKAAALKKNNAGTHHLKCSHLDWLICQKGVQMPMQRLICWAPLLKNIKWHPLTCPLLPVWQECVKDATEKRRGELRERKDGKAFYNSPQSQCHFLILIPFHYFLIKTPYPFLFPLQIIPKPYWYKIIDFGITAICICIIFFPLCH